MLDPLSKNASKAEIMERNMAFYEMLQDAGQMKEAQDTLVGFLRAQMYEGSILEAYQPPTPLTYDKLHRDVNSENVYRVEDREFVSSPAVQLSLRGTPQFERVETDRYQLRLVHFSSPLYALKEQEVRTMQQPIEEILRTQISFHLRKKIDRAWIAFLRAAIATTGSAQQVDFSSTGLQSITPEALVEFQNTLDARGEIDGKYLQAHTLVMTKSQLNNRNKWPQMNSAMGPGSTPGVFMNPGDNYVSKGLIQSEMFGMRVLATMKNDLFRHNEVWVLPDPTFLGHHYTFQDEKFGIVRKFDSVELRGYMSWMYGIGNAYGVGLGTLAPRGIS